MSEAEQPIKSLFVNQILVVTGTNPNTKVFKVKRFYTDASLPLSNKLPSFLKGCYYSIFSWQNAFAIVFRIIRLLVKTRFKIYEDIL